MAAADVIDNRAVKCPQPWNGDKKTWKHWNVKLGGYVGGDTAHSWLGNGAGGNAGEAGSPWEVRGLYS